VPSPAVFAALDREIGDMFVRRREHAVLEETSTSRRSESGMGPAIPERHQLVISRRTEPQAAHRDRGIRGTGAGVVRELQR
jgi:hypothetical protein